MQNTVINLEIFVAFVYTIDELSEKKIQGTVPLIITLKRIEYQGINLTKKVKDLYSENYKH